MQKIDDFLKKIKGTPYYGTWKGKYDELRGRGWSHDSAGLHAKRHVEETIKREDEAAAAVDERLKQVGGKVTPPGQLAEVSDVPPLSPGGSMGRDSVALGGQAAYLNDVFWVYEQIGKEEADRDPAPTSGAAWLLQQADKNPKFLQEPLMMVARKKELDKTEVQFQMDERKSREEIRKILDRIGSRV